MMSFGRCFMDQNFLRKLIVLSGTIGISFSAVFIRYASVPSLVLVLYRMLITAALLAVPVMLKRELRDEIKRADKRVLVFCVLSGIFLTFHFFTYFISVHLTSVASAVLLTDTEVFFTGLAGFLLFRERIPKGGLIGIAIAFLGCILVTMSDAGGGSDMLRGDLLALFSAVMMAGYTMLGRVCRQQLSTTVYTLVVYSVTAVCALLLLLITGTPVIGYEPVNWLMALGMAVMCTLLGHNIFNWGLKYFRSATVSTIKLAEPVFSAILAAAFFREIPTLQAVCGSIVIIFGIWWYLKSSDD